MSGENTIMVTVFADGDGFNGFEIDVVKGGVVQPTVVKPYLSEALRVVDRYLKKWKKEYGKPISKTRKA